MERIIISVVFASPQDIEIAAFKYVILSLNQYQNLFEFCFPDLERELPKSKLYQKKDLMKFCKSAIKDIHIDSAYYIFLINRKIEGNYFSICDGNISVLTTEKWERYFSPPSVFEYIVDSMIANILAMGSNDEITFHENTLGCILDYKRIKTQIRANILLGYICDTDKNNIIKKYGEEYYNQIRLIVSKQWFGDINNRGDIAYNLKHCFKINMNKDSGIEKSFYEKVKDKFVELPFSIAILIITAIISIITSYIVYYFLNIK